MKGFDTLTDLINDCLLEPYVHKQISKAIVEFKEQFAEHSKIANRALLIGEEEKWFDWKDDNEDAYISLHKDLVKIRDSVEIQDYIRLQNMYIESLKLKILELENGVSND